MILVHMPPQCNCRDQSTLALLPLLARRPMKRWLKRRYKSLRRSFGEENVRVREYTMTELAQAIRDEEVDIFLSSAGFYWRLMQSGAVAVASLASKAYPDPNHGEGSALWSDRIRHSKLCRQ
mgnify:CR=1 FL=1